jgi:hypothetical protein
MAAINTLEKIRWERKRVQKELKRLEQSIAEDFNELTAPPLASDNKLESMVNFASRAWSIFDGAMMGYKLFHRFGKATRFLSRGKRK